MKAGQGLPFRQIASHTITRNRVSEHFARLRGEYHVEHTRKKKIIGIYDILNDIVNEGKNDILGVYFHSDTQTATGNWCIGLISLASFTALAAADVMNSHAGWTEFVGYSQANRVAWGPGASAAQSITNSTPATFDINATGTVKGVFVTTQNTKGGTTGKLWATALFTADVPVTSGDQLKITYTVSA